MEITENLIKTANEFCTEGKPLSVTPYGKGHINATYLLDCGKKRYILQKMNVSVFKDAGALMSNICAVTGYLKKQNCGTLTVKKTADGANYLKDGCWRCYEFIENTVTLEKADDEKAVENAGRAFGNFQKNLTGFDASLLSETLPHFHDTPKRFSNFLTALEKNLSGRKHTCLKEIKFVTDARGTLSKVTDGLNCGAIPLRVTHNDTKLNNVLLDADTKEPVAVIDLDTVMAGSLLYDFGDAIRFGASTAEEDEKDLGKVNFSLSAFAAYSRGFLSALGGGLTVRERELMPYSAYLMTMECGMRFLADYLNGDVYFKTAYPEHNLVRCRTQFKLAYEMRKNEREMKKIIDGILG